MDVCVFRYLIEEVDEDLGNGWVAVVRSRMRLWEV